MRRVRHQASTPHGARRELAAARRSVRERAMHWRIRHRNVRAAETERESLARAPRTPNTGEPFGRTRDSLRAQSPRVRANESGGDHGRARIRSRGSRRAEAPE